MPIPLRDALVRALEARVDLFAVNGDPSAALSPEALAESGRLRDVVPDPARDPEAVVAIRDLHRLRAALLGAEAGRTDGRIADALDLLVDPSRPLPGVPAGAAPDPGAFDRAVPLVAAAEEALAAAELSTGPGPLQAAVSAGRAAAEALPEKLRSLLPLSSLPYAKALRLRWARLGDSGDLGEAIRVLRAAEARCAPGRPERAPVVAVLGVALRERYEAGGASTDLEEAVAFCREAVAASVGDRLNHPGHLHNLGIASRLRHERARRPGPCEEAVALHREALAVAAADHPGRLMFLLGLGNALPAGPARLEAYRQALDAAPPGHPIRVKLLSALALDLARHPPAGAGPADDGAGQVAEALRVLMESLPPGDAARATAAGALGVLAVRELADRAAGGRAGRAVERRATAETVGLLRTASRHPAVPPHLRLSAATMWGAAAMAAGDPGQAARALAYGVDLLPLLVPRHQHRRDAEHALALVPHLARDAAACAIAAGQPSQALGLLESGRGVLLARGLEGHDDLAALRAVAPQHAGRLLALRRALEVGDDAVTLDDPGSDRRYAHAAEWEALVARVREQVPGFARFLRPPGAQELLAQAAAGPVVVVNVSVYRCDALVLDAHGLRVVPLPGLTLPGLEERVEGFLRALDRLGDPDADPLEAPECEDVLDGCLRWLWDAVAEPVLDVLGPPVPAAGEPARQRVWWVPTGPLALLPLHAAGRHREPGRRTVPDRVVSSYVPTVRALAHARRALAGPAEGAGHLVVCVPRAPGTRPLPRAGAEGAALAAALPGARLLADGRATRAAVTDALADHGWLHFCGHCTARPESPSDGELVVHDHLERPLTVADVSALRLDGAVFAFLSACGTARSGAVLADEALHPAGALHLAGFRHVVGTLWDVEDGTAARIAAAVYRGLGVPRPDPGRAAGAVHAAVLEFRDRYPRTPSLWAAHIHVGV